MSKRMIINKTEMSKAMAIVSRFVNPRSPADYMQCVRLSPGASSMMIDAVGTHGRCSIPLAVDGGGSGFIANCATLSKTVNLVSGDDIEITVLSNKIRIRGDGPSVEIPRYEHWVSHETPAASNRFSMLGSEFVRCLSVAETVGSESEMRYANGVRVVFSNSTVNFVSAISKCGAFAWSLGEGDSDSDIVLSRGGIGAIKKFSEGIEKLDIETSECRAVFRSECGAMASMSLEAVGAKPPMLSVIEKTWQSSHRWDIDRAGLLEFLRHTLVISSVDASGVWMVPKDDGVLCRYTGISDGTGSVDMSVDATCEYHVDGEKCEGEPVYVSCKLLAPALHAVGESDFKISSIDRRAVVVASDNSIVAVGQMAYPSKEAAQ
jgi:hypothetical protein